MVGAGDLVVRHTIRDAGRLIQMVQHQTAVTDDLPRALGSERRIRHAVEHARYGVVVVNHRVARFCRRRCRHYGIGHAIAIHIGKLRYAAITVQLVAFNDVRRMLVGGVVHLQHQRPVALHDTRSHAARIVRVVRIATPIGCTRSFAYRLAFNTLAGILLQRVFENALRRSLPDNLVVLDGIIHRNCREHSRVGRSQIRAVYRLHRHQVRSSVHAFGNFDRFAFGINPVVEPVAIARSGRRTRRGARHSPNRFGCRRNRSARASHIGNGDARDFRERRIECLGLFPPVAGSSGYKRYGPVGCGSGRAAGSLAVRVLPSVEHVAGMHGQRSARCSRVLSRDGFGFR